jgi:hypothetical protein
MNTPRRAIVLAIVLLLSTGYCVHAESSWSLAKIWPFQHRSAAEKKASTFHTTGYPKSSSRKSQASRLLPSLSSVTSAPKKLWLGTKKVLTPSSWKKGSGKSSHGTNRHRALSDRSSYKSSGKPRTIGEFISRDRPGF